MQQTAGLFRLKENDFADAIVRAEFEKGVQLLGVGEHAAAISHLQIAANQGCAPAIHSLGIIYERGMGVARDIQLACQLYSEASDLGFVLSQFGLARIYQTGALGTVDLQKAKALYKKAAAKDFSCAQNNLAVILHDEGDVAGAVRLLRKAVKQGYPEAQMNLATRYLNGVGVKADKKKGVSLIEQAAQQGFPRAQYCLGFFHLTGSLLPQDTAQAIHYFVQAYEGGCTLAACAMYLLYVEGRVVRRNWDKAFYWYSKARVGLPVLSRPKSDTEPEMPIMMNWSMLWKRIVLV